MIREDSSTQARRLPSVPATALRIVELAQQPHCSGLALWQVVHRDPASVLALLVAAQARHECHTTQGLLAAIEQLGAQQALCVCLAFRLPDPPVLPTQDYIRYWRRAMLTAAYARVIAQRLRSAQAEAIHAAAILHNVDDVCGRASDEWLSEQGLAADLCMWIRQSQAEPGRIAADGDAPACLALAAGMAEVWLCTDWKLRLARTRALAQCLFGAVPDLCSWVFGVLGPQADDLETLAKIHLPGRRECARLYGRAELLRMRLATRCDKQDACRLSGR